MSQNASSSDKVQKIADNKEADDANKMYDNIVNASLTTEVKRTAGTDGAEDVWTNSVKKRRREDEGDEELDWAFGVLPEPSPPKGSAHSSSSSSSSNGKKKKKKKHKVKKDDKLKPPPAKASAKPPKPAPAAASSSSCAPPKVFASQQIRLIMHLEKLLSDGHAIIQQVTNEEGFKTVTDAKISSVAASIDSKVDTTDKCAVLTAVNTSKEGDAQRDLRARGEDIIAKAQQMKDINFTWMLKLVVAQ